MKTIKGFLSVISIICIIILCLAGCSSDKAAVIMLSQKNISEDISAQNTDNNLYTEKKTSKNLTKITRSDLITLYFDEDNYSISVLDSGASKLWSALPESYTDQKPAVLSVDIIAGGKTYTLNSQDDSVALGLASYKTENNEITVTYGFEKSLETGEKINFAVPVKYTVSEGILTVSADCENIRKADMSESIIIENIRLLDYFGADTSGKSGDYIFIPDGSGAIIDTAENAKEFDKITVSVYGDDLALDEKSDASACVAVFGMKKQSAAFVATIEKGDAVSKIIAEKALENSSYNRVGAQFCITSSGETEKGKLYASQKSYQSEIKITYRFLSGSNADYPSMASACREGFIRNGILSMQDSVQSSSAAPFLVSIIGAANSENSKKTLTLTTYEQAQEMLTFFRNKGFSNMIVRYKGIFEGAIRQNNINKADINNNLGSKNELSQFLNYAKLQNISVYADANLLTSQSYGSNAALTPDASEVTKQFTDIKTEVMTSTGSGEFVTASEIENGTNSLIKSIRENSFTGTCLSDAGKYLYSDYSQKSNALRSDVSNIIANQCAAVTCAGSLMMDGANIYSVKYADYIVNMPQNAAVASRDYCTSVPFLQILFHGVKSYTLKPANLCSNAETQFLKSAEYGAVLSCEAYYGNYGTEENTDSMYYINFGSQLQGYYERLSKISDLADKKITDHYMVKEGVYCTEYGDNITVYVNYNKKDVKVGDVSVEARSFIVLR